MVVHQSIDSLDKEEKHGLYRIPCLTKLIVDLNHASSMDVPTNQCHF